MKNYKLIFSIIALIFLFSYFNTKIISKRVSKDIIKYSTVEAERVASIIINTEVNKVIKEENMNDDLLIINKNNSNEIEYIDFNTSNVNYLLKKITENISDVLLNIEEGYDKDLRLTSSLRGDRFKYKKKGIVCEIPTGSISGGVLLANTGPVIPVKLSFIGTVIANISTNIKSYGMNNAYVEIDLDIEVTERATLPGLTKDIKIRKKVPIAMRIIQGNIPNYYGGTMEFSTKEQSSNIT